MTQREYWNPERETMPVDELRELQNEKLRRQVSYGYHNAPIVRELWDEAGVSPDDIHTVEDLADAPVFRKDEARQRQIESGEPFGGRLCRPWADLAEDGAFVSTSSGTTGVSTNVVISERDREVLAECFARNLWGAGLRPGDTFLALDLGFHLIAKAAPVGARKIGALSTQVRHHPEEVGRIAHVLEYLEPSVVWFMSPPLIGPMEEYMRENGLDPAALWEPMEGCCFGGEPLIDPVREELEAEWDVTVYEAGGGLEPGWFTVECEEHGGFQHLQSDHFYVEARDPGTGERVPDGERGELVITPLSYDAMSHLCWAHDDIVEIERGTCDCGRTSARVRFVGRVGDLVTVDGEDLLPRDVLPITYGREGMPDNLFQFFADSEEALRLRLGYDEDAVSDVDAFASEVEDDIETGLGVPVEVVEAMSESDLRELGPDHKIPRVVES